MELFCSDGATLATSTDWLSAFPRGSENAMAGTNSRADLAVLYCDLGRLQEGLAALESTLVGIFRGGRRRGALVLTCARAVIGRSDGPVRLELRGAYGRTVVRREPYRTVVRHRAPYYGRVVVRSGTVLRISRTLLRTDGCPPRALSDCRSPRWLVRDDGR